MSKIITVETHDKNNDYQKEKFKDFIRKFIKYKEGYDDLNEEKRRKVRMNELAIKMEIHYESLKKLINGSRKIKSRDFIIALCSQLQLNSQNTNKALFLYGMPILHNTRDDNYNDIEKIYSQRDTIITQILDTNSKRKHGYSIEYINNILLSNKQRVLEISERNHKKKKEDILFYDTDDLITKTFLDLPRLHNNSFAFRYDISLYSLLSSLVLVSKSNKEALYKLDLDSKGNARIFDLHRESTLPKYQYSSIDDCEHFKEYFEVLHLKNKTEMSRIFIQLDDTKNYKHRLSAKFSNNTIEFFIEEFNYYIPELNEYFYISYSNKTWNYSISNKSRFLKNKIGTDEYIKYLNEFNINDLSSSKNVTLSSIAEIEKYYYLNLHDYTFEHISNIVSKTFCRMKTDLESLIQDLKNKKLFIRDLNSLPIDEYNEDYFVCNHFNLLDSFEFYKDEMKFIHLDEQEIYNEIYEKVYTPKKQEILFDYFGCLVTISINDLREAYKYGLNTLNDILEVKCKFGSIENMIDYL